MNISQFRFFWSAVPSLGHDFQVWWACFLCDYPTGALWAPLSDAMMDPCTTPEPMPFPGFFVTRSPPIHEDVRMTGVPDNTWVEIIRIARRNDKSQERDQCLVGQVWFWAAPGSGEERNEPQERAGERVVFPDRVALDSLVLTRVRAGVWWNTGRSKRLLGSSYLYRRPTCREVRLQGFDSLQFSPFFPKMTLELVDCRGAHRSDALSRWESACPPGHIELRAGTPRPRYAPALHDEVARAWRRCECDNAAAHISCAEAAAKLNPQHRQSVVS